MERIGRGEQKNDGMEGAGGRGAGGETCMLLRCFHCCWMRDGVRGGADLMVTGCVRVRRVVEGGDGGGACARRSV